MKKAALLSTALLLCTLTAAAKNWTPQEIPVVHIQDRNQYVSDPEGILSAGARAEVNALMRTVEDSTGVQSFIAVVSCIDPDDCFEFAYKLGEMNGVGSSETDNGLVILLSTEERCIQMLTGYGIEGSLPDAVCRRIQELYMNPYFAEDNWDAGMVAGAKAIKETLLQEEGAVTADSDDEGGLGGFAAAFAIMMGFIVVMAVRSDRKQRTCPYCKKIALREMSRTLISKSGATATYSVLYECNNCHHQITRIKKESGGDGSSTGGYVGGTFIGGSGGSGHIGGSYGGGHFGGGGAGSRF